MTRSELASKIDHTLLKPEATPALIDQLCDQAGEYDFAAVCVNPIWVARCARRLAGSDVCIASVAGFPLGSNRTESKADEAKRAIEDGAVEIDMVIRLGDLIAGNLDAVRNDIAAVSAAVHAASPERNSRSSCRVDQDRSSCRVGQDPPAYTLKVILETAALTESQIIAGCKCAVDAQADFVKTSTGFHPAGGATVEAVRLLKEHASPLKVKAAGGIHDAQTALAMLEAGADRLGCSASVEIVSQVQGGSRPSHFFTQGLSCT